MSPSVKEIVCNKVRNKAADELEAVEQDTKRTDLSAWPPDGDVKHRKQEPNEVHGDNERSHGPGETLSRAGRPLSL